jgi:hypothetical protein
MSELGQSLPKWHVRDRSALPSNSDISPFGRDFSKVPTTDVVHSEINTWALHLHAYSRSPAPFRAAWYLWRKSLLR